MKCNIRKKYIYNSQKKLKMPLSQTTSHARKIQLKLAERIDKEH